MRQVLVVVQVALSLHRPDRRRTLPAGTAARAANRHQLETRGVLVMNFNLLREGYTPERAQVFFDRLVEKAAALPGVQAAAIAQTPPLGGGFSRTVFPEGADTTTTGRVLVQVNTVGTGYFQTIGVPILADVTSRAPTRIWRPRSSSSTKRWRSSSGREKSRWASGSSSSATRTTRRSSASSRDSSPSGHGIRQNYMYQPLPPRTTRRNPARALGG